MAVAEQTNGHMLRFKPRFHAMVLDGGFEQAGRFFYVPFIGLQPMVEVFRRRVLWMLVEKQLFHKVFAIKLQSWKHSGFSIDNVARILDRDMQKNPAEYISHLRWARLSARIDGSHPGEAPKGTRLRRRYGFYSSRIKGR